MPRKRIPNPRSFLSSYFRIQIDQVQEQARTDKGRVYLWFHKDYTDAGFD
jgi:hypothetical protein